MRISDWSSDVCSSDLYDFPQKAFDMAISRFGVMFFGDSVGAFANIRCAMVPGGALHAIVWRGPRENGFMTTAERAAAPLLPALPPRSEEHTSELQSLMRISYAVFCLKKKNQTQLYHSCSK